MKKVFVWLDRILEWICFASIAGFASLIFIQVVCRYVLKSPLLWQEEVCLYLFYILVLSGAIQAIKNGAHISVDFIRQKLSPQAQLVLKIVVYTLILICCAYIVYSGALYCTNVGSRRSSELRIMMKYIYAVFPVAGALMCACSLRTIVESCRAYFKERGRK